MPKHHKDPRDNRDPADFGRKGRPKPEPGQSYFGEVDCSDLEINALPNIGDILKDPRWRELYLKDPHKCMSELFYGHPPLPAENEEIPEDRAEYVLAEFIERYGEKRVFQAMAETVADMGDLASVLMVMRDSLQRRKDRRDRVEFRGDFKW